ncbi:Unconventional myosin-VIIa [Homalodisca vitripennis]|nr:Unconventional myosin-VIIa [Homalodisca vitripennis]
MELKELEGFCAGLVRKDFLDLLSVEGDYIWIEPVSGREFDVAIGARVVSAEGRRIQVKDDDGKVGSRDGKYCYLSITHYQNNVVSWYYIPVTCYRGNMLSAEQRSVLASRCY